MNAESIFLECWRRGLILDAADGKVQVFGDAAALTLEVKDLISENKERLLQFLDESAWVYFRGNACKVAGFEKDHVLVVLRSRPDRFIWIKREELRLSPTNNERNEE